MFIFLPVVEKVCWRQYTYAFVWFGCLCLVCVPLFGFIYEHCRLSTYLVASPFCCLNWQSGNHLYKSIAYVYQILYDDEESALYEEGWCGKRRKSISTATAWELISCRAGRTARVTPCQPRSLHHMGFSIHSILHTVQYSAYLFQQGHCKQ